MTVERVSCKRFSCKRNQQLALDFFFLSFVHYLSPDFGREKIKKEKRLFFFSPIKLFFPTFIVIIVNPSPRKRRSSRDF